MRRSLALGILALASTLTIVPLSAQRGGGRGGGGGSAPGGNAPSLLTAYENEAFGLKFPAPPNLSLFTPEQPGRFRQAFAQKGRIAYMVNLMGGSGAIVVRELPGATDADLASMKAALESNPPQAKMPDYQKVSVGTIKIGTQGSKDAVEYVYSAKENDVLVTTRQVAFVHKGNGFIFVCSAPEKDFAGVNKKSFDALFRSIEFR